MSAGPRAAALLALVALGCGAEPAARPTPPPAIGARPVGARPDGPALEQGRASYYSDRLAGRPTASGEPYDPRDFTAAHRTLPFGTRLVVTTRDGRSVRVRVNDRGPFAKGRVVDLSRAAAEALGMIRAGVVDVTLSLER